MKLNYKKLEPQNHVEPHKLGLKAGHCLSNREDHQDLIVKRKEKKEERNSGQKLVSRLYRNKGMKKTNVL